jgi:hypothetical protein
MTDVSLYHNMIADLLSRKLYFGLAVMLVSACGETQQRVADPDLKEEIKNRELRHISPGQITQAAMASGQQVTGTIQAALIRKLNEAIAREGLLEAGKYCQPSSLPAADSLSKARSVNINRYRLKGEHARESLSDKEYQLLDAYRYSAERNLPLDPNVQGDKDNLVYNAPVTINDQVCLKCHGRIGKELTQKDYLGLSSRYRLDSLVNLENGQALALWLLRFNRREVIKTIR